MARALSRGKKMVVWALGILVGLVVLVIVGANLYVRVAYSAFYSEAQREFAIPGINDGFVCQDLDFYDEADCWLFSGYATGSGPSPLYRLDSDGSSTRFFATLPDGSPYVDHGSAITTSSEYAFLACEGGYLVFEAADLARAESDASVQAVGRFDLELTPAFMNIENGTLYAGTFHLVPDYPAPPEHHLTTPDGSENAGIILAYPASDSGPYGFAARCACAYSIPDSVQGVCVLPDETMVLSCSYGLASSRLRSFDLAKASSPEAWEGGPAHGASFLADGRLVPLHFLDSNCELEELEAPPMTEGIEFHDGRVYVSEESASNKYVFGKLYGAGQVYSISMD